jgi:threonine/homoserine/homoserine lactone efflux protein
MSDFVPLSFVLAAVLITLAPGPDNLMVLGVGMSRGRQQGIAFGLGCALGCLSHTALAVLGVSAMIAASPMAFTALRWLGGAYLLRLGLLSLKSAGATPVSGHTGMATVSLARQFSRGLMANAINPKVVLFFLAFLPQFVVPSHGSVARQLGLLGVIFTLQAAVLFGTLGWFSGVLGIRLQQRPRAGMWLDRLAGVLFMALALRLVLSA